ncbi:MAG: CRISPR-associated protein [Comamonadaceae bacterium BICA1-1]|nr:MAG: CRISPR-associated protein [Comamonadaceae bacterium BICA1-1]
MTVWFVSRHPGALAWAKSQRLQIDQHASHLDAALVHSGDTVIGTLPVHLAARVCAQGAAFYNLTLDLPEQWRGRELSAANLTACNARLERFHIARSQDELPLFSEHIQ